MLKLLTPVECGKSRIQISYKDKIMIIGSCFADNIGQKMADLGFNVCVNPFGTLYNPVSIYNSIRRLEEARELTPEDCVPMGSGAGLICSFSHHTSFARQSMEEFLENANSGLKSASEFYRTCNRVIITLGTSWCYRHIGRDIIVSNCLKRNADEFLRERLPSDETARLLSEIISSGNISGGEHSNSGGRRFILTVSPIRHMKDGAHGNQISKSSLLLAADMTCSSFPGICEYFPSYEIMMDELRDYRFYSEDMVHPSAQAVNHIWERFCEFALPEEERPVLAANEKLFRQSQHRKMH